MSLPSTPPPSTPPASTPPASTPPPSTAPEEILVPAPESESQPEPPPPPKLGLALSGGGFRASFFHVGVLARLAETGVLRKVDVISTVSGGSILGALYYLALKDLLENVPDDEIRDEHYVRVVRRVERTLYDGVAEQIRARAYANLGKNLRMRHKDYSRSDRIGELYDKIFYRPVWEKPFFGDAPATREFDGPIQMRELLIHPPGETDAFRPLRHNGRRNAPVPILLLNSTAINTGHNWRFQAVEMGEAPRVGPDFVQIDKNMRLLTSRYAEITPRQSDFPLGHAVAASACVPGLFHPLAVSGLFPEVPVEGDTGHVRDSNSVRVQLVDGGVHDNQGVGGLLDLRCERMIISDASGQMLDIPNPSTRIPATAGRSSSIYGDRVREEELVESLARPGTVLVHLRKGLPSRVVAPLGPDGKPLAAVEELGTADYGVAAEVQHLLSRIRTDLDSFSEVEAYSLALYAHAMTSVELPEESKLTYEWEIETHELGVLRAELRKPGPSYLKQLTVAGKRFRKASALSGQMRALERLIGAVVAALVIYIVYLLSLAANDQVPAWTLIVAVAAPLVLLGLYMKGRFKLRVLAYLADAIYTWLVPAILAPFLWVSSNITLWASSKFLAQGRLAKLAAERGRDKQAPPPEELERGQVRTQ